MLSDPRYDPGHWQGGPGLAASGLPVGSESAILDVKPASEAAAAQARRFADLQRRAPIRASRARKRAIHTFDIEAS